MVNDEIMQIVTWDELVIGLVILGVVWYGYIVVKYYRKEISGFSKARKGNSPPAKWIKEPLAEKGSRFIKENSTPRVSDPHAQVHELMQELKLVFAASVHDQLSKEQIIETIGIKASKYTTLPADIKLSIAQHIVNEFSLQVKIPVTQEEINALW